MKLLIDIGNTRCKFALSEMNTVFSTVSIENSSLSQSTLQQHFVEVGPLDSIWVSCVGPDETYATIEQWADHQFGLSANRVLVSERACGITNGYQEHSKLGVDRWVGAIAARQRVAAGDLLVVDAGTAINIEWLDMDNVYQGGVIIPGYELMHRSLTANTSGIDSSLELTDRIIGKTTQQCVNAGLSYGLVGAVDRVVTEMTKLISSPVTLILTGGGAQLLIDRSSLDFMHEPQLLMYGLMQMAREIK